MQKTVPQNPVSQMPILALDNRSRWTVIALVVALLSVGWIYMLYMAWGMQNMATVEMWMPPLASMRPWQGYDFLMLGVMWVLMMAAMMLPSTLPMVLLFAQVQKRKRTDVFMPVLVFVSGYLVAWTVYSLVAVLLQWRLHVEDIFNPMMESRSYLWSGVVLLIAGLYQFTSLKEACLRQCRSPLSFLMAHWREGMKGSLSMGTAHGFYCVGCCWALMAILFAVGVMNMVWIVLLALFALFEKTLLPPKLGSYIAGTLITAWAIAWLVLAQ